MSYHGWVRAGGHETVRAHSFKNSAEGVAPPGQSSDTLITEALPYNFMDVDPSHIRRTMAGLPTHAPQVVLNTHPHARGPWRMMAYIEPRGAAVPSTRIAVRPAAAGMTVEILWALCNSLIANAYVYSHLGKRDITTGDLKRMPVPRLSARHADELTRMVREFLEASRTSPPDQPRLGALLHRVDAVLLAAYGLFAPAEQQIVALFEGHRRPGLPFERTSVGTNSRLPQYLTVSQLDPMLPPPAIGRFVAAADLDVEIDEGRRELAALRRVAGSGDARVAARMTYVRDLLQRLESSAADSWRPPPRMAVG